MNFVINVFTGSWTVTQFSVHKMVLGSSHP